MSVLQNISRLLGYGGDRPQFNAEVKTSTLHNRSSINNDPAITRQTSILDEGDTFNTNKFKNSPGQKYNDKLPR
jgi:hypothetical protein